MITDAVLSDPDEFIRVANRLAEGSRTPLPLEKKYYFSIITRALWHYQAKWNSRSSKYHGSRTREGREEMTYQVLSLEGVEEAKDSFLKYSENS